MDTVLDRELKARTLDEGEVRRYTDQLMQEGVVSVPRYVDGKSCDAVRREIEKALENSSFRIADKGMTYDDLTSAGEPILVKRSGERDDGMIDIFNVENAFPGLRSVMHNPDVLQMISGAESADYEAKNINIYVNRSVVNTRGFHADSYTGQYKAFVYLTDVPEAAFGPYAYVKGSHRSSRLKQRITAKVNEVRGRTATDAVFYAPWKAKRFTAEKGTLIVSHQGGYHRGTPQTPGKERMLISANYVPA